MPNPALAAVARALDPDPPADADLVTRFAETRDEASFAELLRRHGPMVLGVCRRILADSHDADDAFQAAFVVLARRAGAVRPPGRVGAFLYGVAVKTATKAKIMAAKRRARELAGAFENPGAYTPGSPDWSDLRPVIDEELARLPDDLRAAVVLCDLGGKPRSEAARELGWPEGTLATRLAKARELLADRLTRRGVTLSAAGLTALLAPAASSAAVSPALASAALAAALGGSASAVPPSVQILAEGVVRSMYATYWKLGAAVAVALGGLIVGGLAVMADGGPADPISPQAANPSPPAANPPPAVERNEDLWAWQERQRGRPATHVAFAPHGQSFAAGGPDGRLTLYETATGRDLWRSWTPTPGVVAPNPDPVVSAWSPNSGSLAMVTPGGVEFLDPTTGKPFWVDYSGLSFKWPGVGGRAAAYSPDGKRLAVTDGLATRVVGFPPGRGEVSFGPLTQVVKDGAAAAVAWAPDGKRIVFLPNTKIDPEKGTTADPAKATHWFAQVWGAGSGEAMMFLMHGTTRITALAWSADGSTIATADADGGIALWDGKTFAEKQRLTAPGEVTCLTLRADGKRLAVGVKGAKPKDPNDPATAPQVVVYTESEPVKNWMESSRMGGPVKETVRSVAFSPDGKVLAAASEGGLRVWDRVFVKAVEK